jgi:hypothetical protein
MRRTTITLGSLTHNFTYDDFAKRFPATRGLRPWETLLKNRLQMEVDQGKGVVPSKDIIDEEGRILLRTVESLKGPVRVENAIEDRSDAASFSEYETWMKEAMDTLVNIVYTLIGAGGMENRMRYYEREFASRFPLEQYIEMDRYFVEASQRRESAFGWVRQSPFTGKYTREDINKYMVQTIFRYLASEQRKNIEEWKAYRAMLRENEDVVWRTVHTWVIKHSPAMANRILSKVVGGFGSYALVGGTMYYRHLVNYNKLLLVRELKEVQGFGESMVSSDIEYPREYVINVLRRTRAFDSKLYTIMDVFDALKEIFDQTQNDVREAHWMTPATTIPEEGMRMLRMQESIVPRYWQVRLQQQRYERFKRYFETQARRENSVIWRPIREWEDAVMLPFIAGNDRQVSRVLMWFSHRKSSRVSSEDERYRLSVLEKQYYILALDLLRITYTMEKIEYYLGKTRKELGVLEGKLRRRSPGESPEPGGIPERRPPGERGRTVPSRDSIRGEEPSATFWTVF